MSASTHLAVGLGAESDRGIAATFHAERIDARGCRASRPVPVRLPDGRPQGALLHLRDPPAAEDEYKKRHDEI